MGKNNIELISFSYKDYHIQGYTSGTGDKNIILLHGGGVDSALISWGEVIPLFANEYRVYTFDLLGYGDSDTPNETLSLPFYVDMLHSVINQLNLEKFILSGLSLGGGIALGYALKYPDKIEGLIPVGAWGLYSRMPMHGFCYWYVNTPINLASYKWLGKSKKRVRNNIAGNLIGDKSKITEELVNQVYQLLQSSNAGKAFQSFQRYELGKKEVTTNLLKEMHKLKVPVLFINGEKDPGVPVKYVKVASNLISDSKIHIMKGCKHWTQKERPEEYVEVVKNFINNIER